MTCQTPPVQIVSEKNIQVMNGMIIFYCIIQGMHEVFLSDYQDFKSIEVTTH